jgi:hypothetical protein
VGLPRSTGGGLILGPGGGVLRRPSVVIAPVRRIEPTSVNFLSSASPGTKIADLVFFGFDAPAGGSGEFTGYDVTLASDAGGRVAISGTWATGYKLVVGAATLGGSANYTIIIAVGGIAETFPIVVVITADVAPVTIVTTRVESADTVTSLADQEVQAGIVFRKGDVPAGNIVTALVDGVQVPCQLSNRIFWNDGSLKHAQARWLMPSIAPGTGKDVTWRRISGTWAAQDTALHTSPTAITSKVALEYAFSSWKGRTTANVLTAERGPKTFRSATMLAAANSQWIDTVMSGPVCTEWRVSDMAALSSGTKDANFGCWLYVRAWGGTANNPKRIQFLFKTIYGWSTDVAADEQGIQVNMDLKVNGTTIRGNSIGTAGWGAVNSFKGGWMASAGATGQMDWFDVATNAWITLPKLVHRHDVAYAIQSRLFPPYDTTNPQFPLTTTPPSYGPMQRGLLRPVQDDVGDSSMIAWGTTQPHAWAIAAHARATAAQLVNFEQTNRVTALGMGCMYGQGYNRTTRKINCHLPPARNPDPTALGPSIWNGTRPANPNPAYNTVITTLDAAHFPQINLWTYMSEGDQHFLDALYMETTLPGLFEADAYGFFGTMDWQRTPFGGISMYGQIRAVGHGVRPGLAAYGMGNPADVNWKLAKAYVMHWIEMSRLQPFNSTEWRATGGNGNARTDGRRYQDLHLKELGPSSSLKPWMHYFGTQALCYGYALTEDPDVKEQAEWWSYIPMVLAGGYHNDTDPALYCYKPDPYAATSYSLIACNLGSGNTNEDLRPFYPGQWHFVVEQTTYKADNQTCMLTPTAGDMVDGLIVTITGIFDGSDPPAVTDMTKIPAGLTRGIPYYSVQSSGVSFKLSLSRGGAPVTFNAGGSDITGACIRRAVAGVTGHTFRLASAYSTAANNYFVHAISTLAFIKWYVSPDDPRIKLAYNNLLTKKTANPGDGYDVRGKTIVPP